MAILGVHAGVDLGWQIRLRGGAYSGWRATCDETPQPVLIAWHCSRGCQGHGTFDPDDERIVLQAAESYRRVELDADGRTAVYEVGIGDPDTAGPGRELVPAGAGEGWA